MNKPKRLLAAAASRVLLNTFVVLTMVVLAGLIGVGGAALWIYGRTDMFAPATKHSTPRVNPEVAKADTRNFPILTPVQTDDEAPARLIPAHYMPNDSEIATISSTPRYTYVSYNGGRQQAHLRVNTVLSTSVPAPLASAPVADTATAETSDRPPLSDAASRYITDAHGRVIGIDGSASLAAEASTEQGLPVTHALPMQAVVAPEVRVAAPVTEYGQPVYTGGKVGSSAGTDYLPSRKALPVGEEDIAATTASDAGFNVRAELAREDDRPALRAQPVVAHPARSTRSSMFGASDNLQAFGRE